MTVREGPGRTAAEQPDIDGFRSKPDNGTRDAGRSGSRAIAREILGQPRAAVGMPDSIR
jgi:hypothetical protein